MSRHYYRCNTCLSVVVVEEDDRGGNPNRYPKASIHEFRRLCICGGKYDWMGLVSKDPRYVIRTDERCPCDDRCTNARGPSCDCRCGGENHGSQRLVTVITGIDKVPTIAPPDHAALVRAEDFRSAIKAAQSRVEARWGHAGDLRARGIRVSWEDWQGFEWDQVLIQKACRLKTQRGRLEALARICPPSNDRI